MSREVPATRAAYPAARLHAGASAGAQPKAASGRRASYPAGSSAGSASCQPAAYSKSNGVSSAPQCRQSAVVHDPSRRASGTGPLHIGQRGVSNVRRS